MILRDLLAGDYADAADHAREHVQPARRVQVSGHRFGKPGRRSPALRQLSKERIGVRVSGCANEVRAKVGRHSVEPIMFAGGESKSKPLGGDSFDLLLTV